MAIKTVLVDDLDGSPLPAGASSTTFSLNGTAYEIDLGPDNVEKLKDALEPFIRAGRRIGTPTRGRAQRGSSRSSGNDLSRVREWAREQGMQISERGRVPAHILDAYNAAH